MLPSPSTLSLAARAGAVHPWMATRGPAISSAMLFCAGTPLLLSGGGGMLIATPSIAAPRMAESGRQPPHHPPTRTPPTRQSGCQEGFGATPSLEPWQSISGWNCSTSPITSPPSQRVISRQPSPAGHAWAGPLPPLTRASPPMGALGGCAACSIVVHHRQRLPRRPLSSNSTLLATGNLCSVSCVCLCPLLANSPPTFNPPPSSAYLLPLLSYPNLGREASFTAAIYATTWMHDMSLVYLVALS